MLYYHKCDDCLTAFTTEEKKVDFCDCNGTVTFMGVVQGDKFIKTEDKPPCDGRCTHASGPHCDCLCGGANHGTGKLVAVVVKEGKVYATSLQEEDIERAHMYRGAREKAIGVYHAKWGAVDDKIKSGIYVDRPEYVGYINAVRELEKAIAMRQHMPRIMALATFISKHKV
jgi:hypothetical protein